MATVDEKLARKIIEKKGYYHPEDPRVLTVLTYDSSYGGQKQWAICYSQRELEGYYDSPYCRNIEIEWKAKS